MHLSLGIFNRLWSLLSDACSELDLKLAESSEEQVNGGSTYNHYVTLIRRRSVLRTEMNNQKNYVTVVNEMVTFASISLSDAEHNSVLKELRRDSDAAHTSLNNMVLFKVFLTSHNLSFVVF